MGISPTVLKVIAFVLTGACATSLSAQTLNRDLTDPVAIAQECGGDAAAGQPIFAANCAACHALKPEEQSTKAPHLAELYGRPSASLQNVTYSAALQDTLVIWEGETLHRFLAGDMSIPGHPVLNNEQARRDVLTYLRTETRPAPPDLADVVVPDALLALKGDAEYGEYLASDCAACHNAGAQSQGNFNIYGRPREEFLHLMVAYQERALPNPIMQMTAARYSHEELAALAEWFAKQSPPGGG